MINQNQQLSDDQIDTTHKCGLLFNPTDCPQYLVCDQISLF